jgi:hypothetical protein
LKPNVSELTTLWQAEPAGRSPLGDGWGGVALPPEGLTLREQALASEAIHLAGFPAGTSLRVTGGATRTRYRQKSLEIMNSKELFALFLRIVGVLGIIYEIHNIGHKVSAPSQCLGYLVVRVVYVLIGLYLIRGAPLLVKFAHCERASDTPAPKN